MWAIFRALGELFRTQDARHSDVETNDTSATAATGQHETGITNARLQTATVETAITSAPDKRTQNSYFSPAKATPVSIPHAHERAKAMAVSRERFAMPAGYGGAWPFFNPTHRTTHQRPGAAGVEGAGGTGGHGRASRSTTPSRRLACGDLAGGRARRRPEHQRGNSTAENQAISGSRAPSGSPTRKQHPPGQASAPNRRRPARGPRPRR